MFSLSHCDIIPQTYVGSVWADITGLVKICFFDWNLALSSKARRIIYGRLTGDLVLRDATYHKLSLLGIAMSVFLLYGSIEKLTLGTVGLSNLLPSLASYESNDALVFLLYVYYVSRDTQGSSSNALCPWEVRYVGSEGSVSIGYCEQILKNGRTNEWGVTPSHPWML